MSINILFRAFGRFGVGATLLLAGWFLAGCQSTPPQKSPGQQVEVGTGAPGGIESDVYHVGDSVTVVFTDLPTLTPAFDEKVKEDGTITLLLNQPFAAAGKTRGELEKEIRKRYVPDYFKYMTVTIKPKEQTLFYYVDGEIKLPARQTFIERTTVLKAIASAGGFTDFAKKKAVKLTRLDGRQFTVNCVKARTNPSLDLEVHPGDKIYVPRKIF